MIKRDGKRNRNSRAHRKSAIVVETEGQDEKGKDSIPRSKLK